MALSTKFSRLDLQTFFTGSSLFDARISPLPLHFTPHRSLKLVRRRNTGGIKGILRMILTENARISNQTAGRRAFRRV
ncbi:hypothetical protein K2173_014607 [Erythroxylum novogranatense]|uniref:Uncharacterized protein n=1 Tax=Erythroxylum novogranatense TaxID=1862640 RepID=A0AAV8TGT1_9ROSI|nr:hypothetical protein K2173_014607 [Erythroxylum novogranatense]